MDFSCFAKITSSHTQNNSLMQNSQENTLLKTLQQIAHLLTHLETEVLKKETSSW